MGGVETQPFGAGFDGIFIRQFCNLGVQPGHEGPDPFVFSNQFFNVLWDECGHDQSPVRGDGERGKGGKAIVKILALVA